MAKKKNSMALFEAISKSQEKQSQGPFVSPTWLRQQAQQAAAAKASSEEEVQAGPTHQGPARQAPPPPDLPAGGAEAPPLTPKAATPPPLARKVEAPAGRLTVSVSSAAAAAIAAGLVLVMALMFWLGRATAPRSAPADGRAAVIEPLPAPPGQAGGDATGAAKAERLERQIGKYYLVVQALVDDSEASRQEAKRIVDFLQENNESADVRRWSVAGKLKYAVWSAKGFASDRSREAVEFARAVEGLGQQYKQRHRTYDFRQSSGIWYVMYSDEHLRDDSKQQR